MLNVGGNTLILCILYLAKLSAARLVWSDEFNEGVGTTPSLHKWRYDLGDGTMNGIPGWGNGELQYYTNASENCATNGQGHLVITAVKQNSSHSCYYGQCSYTSTRLVSLHTQTYGRFEARMKTPSGKGIWPAFWMLGEDINTVGWPKCGEIDVLEVRGSQPSKSSAAMHGPGYSGGDALSATYTLNSTNGETFGDDFHVFAVEWEPNRVRWLVDNDTYFTRTPENIPVGRQWVFDKPFKMLINLAIGGHFDGYPSLNETFPKMLYVDYVRVYDYEKKDESQNITDSSERNSSRKNNKSVFKLIISYIISLLLS